MSQRPSGYERKANDLYETPEWVTETLIPHIPERVRTVLEPSCGSGKMVRVLIRKFPVVAGFDLQRGHNFLEYMGTQHHAIITNPPYGLAQEFIENALTLTRPVNGFVAMLLRTDYDHAKTRQHLFEFPFAKKLVLTRRIKWFENTTGSPSFNHAWFIWDWLHEGAPTIAYGPKERAAA
jgi:hypothetical protein